jgi:hypothetical protein
MTFILSRYLDEIPKPRDIFLKLGYITYYKSCQVSEFMSQTYNTDIEHDSAALMAQNGETKANGRKRVLIVGAGAAGYVSLVNSMPVLTETACLRLTIYQSIQINSM